jgi:hypothetical protein
MRSKRVHRQKEQIVAYQRGVFWIERQLLCWQILAYTLFYTVAEQFSKDLLFAAKGC